MSVDKIAFNDFLKVKICVGTILLIEESQKLKKPAYILTIDFGKSIGLKKSSAQLTANYDSKNLINRQVVAVVNFMPKQIGNIMSEVLVLGLPDDSDEPILISPDQKISNGRQIY
jgi:tRNA-binding protein